MKTTLLVLVTFTLAACAHQDLKQPGAPEEKPPGDVTEAMSAVDRAEREIEGALGRPMGMAAAPADHRVKQDDSAAEEAESRGSDACATACRALASMGRASEHLCGLTGEADARCSDARSRLRGAEERVRASCRHC